MIKQWSVNDHNNQTSKSFDHLVINLGGKHKNHYGVQSVRYLVPKIWEAVPNNIKYCTSLHEFK